MKMLFWLMILVWVVVCCMWGCTITPAPVVARHASFDGNEQTSGLLHRLPDGNWQITSAGHARYIDLIARGYGRAFTPPLTAEAGLRELPDGTWSIDSQHLVYFGLMATKKRTEQSP